MAKPTCIIYGVEPTFSTISTAFPATITSDDIKSLILCTSVSGVSVDSTKLMKCVCTSHLF